MGLPSPCRRKWWETVSNYLFCENSKDSGRTSVNDSSTGQAPCAPAIHLPKPSVQDRISPSTAAFLQLSPSPGPLWHLSIPNGIPTPSQRQGWAQRGGGDKNDLSCFSWIQNFTISESGFYTHTHIQRKGRRGWNEEESRVSSWHIEWRQYVVKVLK